MAAMLAPYLQPPRARLQPIAGKPQIFDQIMVQHMAARLRLKRQHEGRISVDIDGLDRIHLDRNNKTQDGSPFCKAGIIGLGPGSALRVIVITPMMRAGTYASTDHAEGTCSGMRHGTTSMMSNRRSSPCSAVWPARNWLAARAIRACCLRLSDSAAVAASRRAFTSMKARVRPRRAMISISPLLLF